MTKNNGIFGSAKHIEETLKKNCFLLRYPRRVAVEWFVVLIFVMDFVAIITIVAVAEMWPRGRAVT